MTILWSATAIWLGSLITGIIVLIIIPSIFLTIVLLVLTIIISLSSSSSGTWPGQRPVAQNPLKTKTFWYSLLQQFLLDENINKCMQVRKLTPNEMTCDLANSQQSSNLGVRLQPSKSQVDLSSLSNNLFK